MANPTRRPDRSKRGFTLVEIMVVVTIIALIASIAIPAFKQSRQNSLASKTASDFRGFAAAFEVFSMREGYWPDDGLPGGVPNGMEGALNEGAWFASTAIGGNWDYDYNVFGFTVGVSIDGYTESDDTLLAIDRLIDDGDLSSGRLRITNGQHLSYVLVE